jgi:hypothetical protein
LSFAPFAAGAAAPTVPELAQAARNANARGEAHRAIHYLQQILDQEPGNESALRAQARLLGAQGYPVQAGERWARLPKDAEALQGLAAAAAAASATAEAAGQVDPALLATASAALEAGQGVWVNGDLSSRVKVINDFNLAAPKAQRLRYVFVACGSIHLAHGSPVLTLDLRPARIAASTLAGEAQAHLWLTVSTRGAKGLGPAAWQGVASQLAGALASEPKIGGIHLAPDGSLKAIGSLIAALRGATRLPLSALLPTATAADFAAVDLVVLRGWGRNLDPEAYKSRIRDQVAGFMRAAGGNQAKAMVGLPVRGPQGPELFRAGRDGIGLVLTPDQGGPMGLGLMGLVDDDSGLGADWDPQVWEIAKNPVQGP